MASHIGRQQDEQLLTPVQPDIITRICCFSPCLEQVLRTVTTLRTEGYTDISTQEVLVRTHDLAQPSASSSSRLSSVTEIVDRLKEHEQRKEERRVIQMRTAREKSRKQKEAEAEAETAAAPAVTATDGATAKSGDGDPQVGDKRPADTDAATEQAGGETKKPRTDGDAHRQRDLAKLEEMQASLAHREPTRASLAWTEPEPLSASMVLTKPAAEMRGHTSYLTFATLHPLAIREETIPAAPKPSRVGQLKESEATPTATATGSPTETGGSEYGSEAIDEALRAMTEEEMFALAGDT